MRGDKGKVSELASRLLGSPDIYGHKEREPEQSINFITCHDGFTLNDLVSYNEKHNDANGEQNRDGSNDNLSWNCGFEGPTDDPVIQKLRNRQVKNFISLLFLAAGAPMLLMGDEVRRTQKGNNNAYVHDNEISWFDWSLLDKHRDVHRFVKRIITSRLRTDVSIEDPGISLNQFLKQIKLIWHGVKLNQPDWGPDSHSIALIGRSLKNRFVLHVMINAYWENLSFEVPAASELSATDWRRLIDTGQESPNDICFWEEAPVILEPVYSVQPRSLAVLLALIKEN